VYCAARRCAWALQYQHESRRQALLPGHSEPGRRALLAAFVWAFEDLGIERERCSASSPG